MSLTLELSKRGRFAKVSHKFQSVGKRNTPLRSVLPVLGFKCVCPGSGSKARVRFRGSGNNTHSEYRVMGEKYGCMGSFFHGRPVSVLEKFQRDFSNTSNYRCFCNFSYNVYDVQTQNEKGGEKKGRITGRPLKSYGRDSISFRNQKNFLFIIFSTPKSFRLQKTILYSPGKIGQGRNGLNPYRRIPDRVLTYP